MNRPQRNALILFVILLASIGGYFLLRPGGLGRGVIEKPLGFARGMFRSTFDSKNENGDENGGADASGEAGVWVSDAPGVAGAVDGQESTQGEWTRFSDQDYGFSFDYPALWRLSTIEDDEYGGEVFLFEGAGAGQGFQIFLSPFDEPLDVMTPERIQKDAPEMIVESPQVVLVGAGEQLRAFIFESEAEGIGKTREVWLIHGGFLYQITAPISADAAVAKTMATWQFE